jgi:hypothetical protein
MADEAFAIFFQNFAGINQINSVTLHAVVWLREISQHIKGG